MTIDVSRDVEASIKAAVQSGRFASADEMITQLVREYENRTEPRPAIEPSPASVPAEKSIWDVLDELRQSVPAEEWAKLPVDGASQHDHYIDGRPKRST